jgi:hypothetical protein
MSPRGRASRERYEVTPPTLKLMACARPSGVGKLADHRAAERVAHPGSPTPPCGRRATWPPCALDVKHPVAGEGCHRVRTPADPEPACGTHRQGVPLSAACTGRRGRTRAHASTPAHHMIQVIPARNVDAVDRAPSFGQSGRRPRCATVRSRWSSRAGQDIPQSPAHTHPG